jgi:hypothetical protein
MINICIAVFLMSSPSSLLRLPENRADNGLLISSKGEHIGHRELFPVVLGGYAGKKNKRWRKKAVESHRVNL